MAEEADAFHHESLEQPGEVARYVRAMAACIEQGRMEFANGKGRLLLSPRGLVELDVRAKRKGKRSKVTFRFSWREDAGVINGGDHPLDIRAGGKKA